MENDNTENGVQIVASGDDDSDQWESHNSLPDQIRESPYSRHACSAAEVRLFVQIWSFSMNAPPMVEVTDQTDTLQIALEELKQKKVFLLSFRVITLDSPDYSQIPS